MAKWRVITHTTYPLPNFSSPEWSEEDPKDYEPEVSEFDNYYEAHFAYLREAGRMNTETAMLERVAFELWNDKQNEWVTLFESRCYHTLEAYGL